jgi:hypothetical protein
MIGHSSGQDRLNRTERSHRMAGFVAVAPSVIGSLSATSAIGISPAASSTGLPWRELVAIRLELTIAAI